MRLESRVQPWEPSGRISSRSFSGRRAICSWALGLQIGLVMLASAAAPMIATLLLYGVHPFDVTVFATGPTSFDVCRISGHLHSRSPRDLVGSQLLPYMKAKNCEAWTKSPRTRYGRPKGGDLFHYGSFMDDNILKQLGVCGGPQ